jgi:hypothetical protein
MHEIIAKTKISRSQIFRIEAKARERGWDPIVQFFAEVDHVADAKRTGRPPISIEAAKCIVQVVTKNSTTRGYSCAKIAREVKKLGGHSVAPRTVYKILKDKGYSCCKLTVKPGLNKDIKKARYDWALKYKHWKLED